MDADRWRLLQDLFAEAVELPEPEREAYLSRTCAGDDALRREVERLLATDTTVLGEAVREAAQAALPSVPDRVGSYRIVHELGRGGMGEVYLAERDDGQFEQRVAVKLLSGGTRSPRIMERFRAERQILARLEHPFIARLIDGGATESGTPYFVMEYVDGEPLDTYCDSRKLSVRERLELFRRICTAVETAHRNLVVHRDLKPSNILVTDDGTPKMLDFGIAKLLEGGAEASLTKVGEQAMTPDYASPEQVRGEPVSTATDVYALGLLLYELLTGEPAQRVGSRHHRDIERAVCETTPTRPSDVAITETAARDRKTTPSSLGRSLAGDLDNIVSMALRKEPERRYGSVSELSEDLRRHLEGRPVQAHEDSATYRIGKFIRRHRVSVLATASVVTATVAGLVGATWQARRATREARHAEEVSEFLVNLLEVGDPETSQGRDVTVREVLDVASVRVRTELSSQPELQAALQTLLGRLYLQLGEYEAAMGQAQDALERRRRLHREGHPAISESRILVARVLLGQGELDAAEIEATEVLAIQRAGSDELAIAETLSVLGEILENRGNYDEARERLAEAATLQKRHPEAKAAVGETRYRQAFVELQDGNYRESERLYGEALAIAEAESEGKSLQVARNLRGLAFANVMGDRHAEAETLMLEAVSTARELLGDDHAEVASFLNGLAIVRDRRGDPDGAEEAYMEALRVVETSLGPDHPLIGTIWNNLGVLRHRQERYHQAADYYARAVSFRQRVLGPDHPLVGTTMSFQAYALQRAGEPEAVALFRRSLEKLEAARGPDHPDVANVLNDLGRLLLDEGRIAEAEPMLDKAVAIRREVFGDDNVRVFTAQMNHGAAMCRGGKAQGAAVLENARRSRAEFFGEEAWQVVEADLLLAECYAVLGRSEEARKLFRAARGWVDAERESDHWLARLARAMEAGRATGIEFASN